MLLYLGLLSNKVDHGGAKKVKGSNSRRSESLSGSSCGDIETTQYLQKWDLSFSSYSLTFWLYNFKKIMLPP